MKHHKIFLILIGLLFAAFTIVFLFFPRSTFSETERRELKTFPDVTPDSLKSGDFTKAVSEWFSDSGPYRDEFMTAHMMLKEWFGWRSNDPDAIVIHEKKDYAEKPEVADDGHIDKFEVMDGAEEKAKLADRGIIVVGAAPNARALMIYGGVGGGDKFAEAVNRYKEVFPNLNVYAMVIPNSTEYYIPDQVKSKSQSMYSTVVSVHEKLKNVKPVDVYTVLGQHAKEDIFLRTDHHWAPLGAYYAAQKFAQVAGVPFKDLKSYDRNVVHEFVGTMYGYSKDIAIKNSPEDFVYFTPRDIPYTTEYINYTVNKNLSITKESQPITGEFFVKFNDGSGMAYSTFMGGDTKLTKVRTGTKNGRRLMIIKDSFGNALPGYLFYSFEQINVVDSRYFNRNMREYIRENGITDILFALNVFRVYTPSVGNSLMKLLDGNVTNQPAQTSKPVENKGVAVKKNKTDVKPATKSVKPKEAPAKKTVEKPIENNPAD